MLEPLVLKWIYSPPPPPLQHAWEGKWRWALAVLIALAVHKADAQYFVDCTQGSNGNGTSGSPWNTLTSVPELGNNATLSLKRGCACEGRIAVAAGASNVTIDAYGTGVRPIIYGSVKPGSSWSDPESDGTWRYDLPTTWPATGEFFMRYANRIANIYDADGSIAEAFMPIARYPNPDQGDGWMRNEAYTEFDDGGTTYASIEPTGAIGYPTPIASIDGATLIGRTSNSSYHPRLLSVVNGVARFEPYPMGYTMGQLDWGFFLQNLPGFIDQGKEWCIVPSVYTHSASTPPGSESDYTLVTAGHVLYKPATSGQPVDARVSKELFGVLIRNNASNVSISGIAFKHQRVAGVRIRGGSQNVTVSDCEFNDLYYGVLDNNAPRAALAAQHINSNDFKDVYTSAANANTNGSELTGNTLHRIGLHASLAESGFGDFSGLTALAHGFLVEDNVIEEVGYAGISLNGSGTCQNNYVSGALSILNDGGGISFNGITQMLLKDNVLVDMAPGAANMVSVARTDNAGSPYDNRGRYDFGIYFGDGYIRNTTLEGNVVTGCSRGIHVDHTLASATTAGQGVNVVGNTLFGNTVQLGMTDISNYRPAAYINEPLDAAYHVSTAGNDQLTPLGTGANYRASYVDTYEDNILYCTRPEQRCLEQGQARAANFGAFVNFGNFSGNFYFDPFDRVTHYQSLKFSTTGPNPITDYFRQSDREIPWTLGGWQIGGAPGQDASSSIHPLRIPAYRLLTPLAFQNIAQHSDDCSAVGIWLGSPQVQAGYLTFTNNNYVERWGAGNSSYTLIDPNNASATTPAGHYRITTRMRSANTDAIQLGPVWNISTNPGKYRTPYGAIGLTSTWSDEEVILDLTDPNPGDNYVTAFQNVQFAYSALSSSTIEVDDVKVERVELDNGYLDEVALNHILRYNCPLAGSVDDPRNVFASNGSFELIGCWSDVYGNIHSGTVTLAPWESIVLYRVPDVFDIDLAQYDVQGNETWSTDKKVRGSVVIGNGETLTVDGATIEFADSRQDEEVLTNIVVEAGGTLELINGAHLTTLETCGANSMWDGVKNFGNVDPNAPQGMVHVLSGSRISNSLTGILGGEGDPMNPGYAGPIKNGLIDIRDAFFENNLHDVVLHGLPNGNFFLDYWDVPFFQNTTFSTTAHLNYDDLDPVAHVRVADHGQSIFLGCTFANDLPTHTQSHRMGLGIQGLNANIAVWGNGAGSSTFRNLDHAIHNMASAGAPYTNVVLSEFIDNICAVYMKDVPGFAIRGNTVQMGRWGSVELTNSAQEFWGDAHRAFFATGSNAFSILDNTLSRSPANTTPLEGVVVGYTSAENEVVFRNSASDLDVAFVGEGECADVNGDPNIAGLQYQCCTNDGNAVNMQSRPANGASQQQQQSHTIRGRQGTPTYSASNSFDGPLHFEVLTRAAAIEYIEYSHVAGDAPATYTQQNPNDLDADYLTPVQVSSGIGCLTGQPVWIAGTGGTFTELKPVITARKLEYGNLRYQLEQLIDGGSTDETVQEITDTWPQHVWDLRDSLLSKSPFLSVDALKELVNKDVPVAMKAEILIANPDATKKEGFLKWAETEADYPIPGYLAEAIEASWETRTYRTVLEENIADKHTRLNQAVNRAIELLQTDTVPPPPDSLRWAWQQLRTNRARYAEAALLMGRGQFAEADSLIEAMPAEHDPKAPEEAERQRMLKYIDVLATAAADARNAYQLTAAEVDSLDAMIGTNYDRPANWASNLLCAVYDKCRAPYTGNAGAPKSNRTRQREEQARTPQAAQFSIQPNPSRAWVAFSYNFAEGAFKNGSIIVRDLSGRSIATMTLSATQGQELWDVRSVAPGTYVVQYMAEQRLVHTEKLIIQQ